MRDNLMIYNIEEVEGENCELKELTFISENLKIDDTEEIRINLSHTVGAPRNSKIRPLVVKFVLFPYQTGPSGN